MKNILYLIVFLISLKSNAQAIGCSKDTIRIRTGVDNNGTFLPIGASTPLWQVTSGKAAVFSGTLLGPFPRNSYVIPQNPAWHVFPNTQWIFYNPSSFSNQNDTFNFRRCFCVDSADSFKIKLRVMADDISWIGLTSPGISPISLGAQNTSAWNGIPYFRIGPTTNGSYPNGGHANIDTNIYLDTGRHCLDFTIADLGAVVTGLDVDGMIYPINNSQSVFIDSTCCIGCTVDPYITDTVCGTSGVLTAHPNGVGCTFQWYNGVYDPANIIAGATSSTFTPPSGGTYSVEIRKIVNSDTCYGITTYNTSSSAAVISILGSPNICPGITSTSLSASTNLPGTLSYSWSGPTGFSATTQMVSVSTPGTYKVTVLNTSISGCMIEDSVVVTSAPKTTTISQLGMLCDTTAFSAGVFLRAMGDPTDVYLWSNGATTSTTNINLPGTYTVTVTAINGCTAIASHTVLFVPFTVNIATDTICYRLTAHTSHPNAITYVWSGPGYSGTGNPVIVPGPGRYFVTVTNASGCLAIDSIDVFKCCDWEIDILADTNLCDTNTVTITALPNPMSPRVTYTYNWSIAPWNTPSVTTSQGGMYYVTICALTNINDTIDTCCVVDSFYLLPCCDSFLSNISSNKDTICTNGSESAILTVTSNSSDIVVVWSSGGGTFNPLTVNSPGIYCAIVTDTLTGCTDTICKTIYGKICDSILDSCSLNSATLNLSTGIYSNGSFVPFGNQYDIWKISSGPNIGTYPRNAYSITTFSAWDEYSGTRWISDINTSSNPTNNVIPHVFERCFCIKNADSFDINLNVLVDDISVVKFKGATWGTATSRYLPVNGGTPLVINRREYLTAGRHCIQFETRNMGGTAYGLDVLGNITAVNGSTTAILKDSCCKDSCTTVATVTSTDIMCFGVRTGVQLTANPAGKIYKWSNGQTTQSINIFQKTGYSVTVYDILNNNDTCKAIYNDSVLGTFTQVNASVIGNTNLCDSNGTTNITANLSNSYTNVSYQWSGPNGYTNTTKTINVGVGSYTVTITDNVTGCQRVASINILVSRRPVLIIQNGVFCDTTNPSCVRLEGMGGINYDWTLPDGSFSSGPVVNVNMTGIYMLVITNQIGCIDTLYDTVDYEPLLVDIIGDSLLCGNSIVLTANTNSNNDPSLSYNWSGPNATSGSGQTINASNIGMYYVTVTNSCGCVAVDSFEVKPCCSLNAGITSNRNVLCAGSNQTASLTISPSNVTITWIPTGGNANPRTVSVAGTYCAVVDSAGCRDTVCITINDTCTSCNDTCDWHLNGNTSVKPWNFIGAKNNEDFRIRTNNIERMQISRSGNVGIGGNFTPTNTPTHPLHVDGKARVQNMPTKQSQDAIVFAARQNNPSTEGELRELPISNNTNDYLAGDGTWKPIPSSPTTTNSLVFTNPNTITSIVNGVTSATTTIGMVSNTSSANTLLTTVNGVSGVSVPIINSNVLNYNSTTQSLTTEVNGVTSNPITLSIPTGNFWSLIGNAGTNIATNFIGTTDNQDLAFRRNNIPSGLINTTNTIFGNASVASSSTGINNSVFGANNLTSNTTGVNNTVVGVNNLNTNTIKGYNVAVGTSILPLNNGEMNVGVGHEALFSATTSRASTAIGHQSLKNSTTGQKNTAIGAASIQGNTTGSYNTALGNESLWSNTSGSYNIGVGFQSLDGSAYQHTGSHNLAIGYQSLYNHITGDNNIALGNKAGNGLSTGAENTFIGKNTGMGITNGSQNTIVGSNVSGLPTTLSNHTILADGLGRMRFLSFSDGNVYLGAGNTLPANNGHRLHVEGMARITNLPAKQPTDAIVFAGVGGATTDGELRKLAISGNTNQYLAGNGTWQFIPQTASYVADEGVTLDGNVIKLGDVCGNGKGAFQKDREISMNQFNLYFNSGILYDEEKRVSDGKIYMGGFYKNNRCKKLDARLEISSEGLFTNSSGNNFTPMNDYSSPDASLSGLRFSDLTAKNIPIPNNSEKFNEKSIRGVLSLDEDGDVIWVEACCSSVEGYSAETSKEISILREENVQLKSEIELMKEKFALLEKTITALCESGCEGLKKSESSSDIDVLYQSIPNPTDDIALINYYLTRAYTDASISIATADGKVLQTIKLDSKAGNGSIKISLGDISEGTYLYTLVAGERIINTKKLQILK